MDLYILDYLAGGKGCPEFIGGTLTPFPTWKPFFAHAHELVKDVGFTFKCKHKALACDYFTYGAHYIVSRKLKSLFEAENVLCSFASVRMEYSGGAIDESEFFLFCPGDHRSVIDLKASTYTPDISGETGLAMNHAPDFPQVPNLARIDAFVVDASATTDASLFFCIDVGALACSGRIAAAIKRDGLRGLRLTPLDASYRYIKYSVSDD